MTQLESGMFYEEIRTGLEKNDNAEASLQSVLEKTLAQFDCTVGTIHGIDPKSGMLKMLAWKGLPEMLLDKVRMIPIGKGMAGIAAQRKEPVQVCNLQTDASGVAKPSARETRVEGSITVPMLVDGKLCGTLGIAKPVEYEFNKDEIDSLMKLGSLIGKYLSD